MNKENMVCVYIDIDIDIDIDIHDGVLFSHEEE
jgi:hypothetical protein